ncbi:MAG: PEP-CTERM sorting domain-containing protein [Tepidisphaeraceae bacterium]
MFTSFVPEPSTVLGVATLSALSRGRRRRGPRRGRITSQ